MKLNIDKKSSNRYYSEVLSVMSDYSKLKINPHRKLKGKTTDAIRLMAISLIFLLLFSALYLSEGGNLYLFIAVIFLVAFALSIVYNILISRRISRLKNNPSNKKLIIEKDYVEMTVGDEITRLLMSEIQWIIINRYSIAFLPKDASSKMIAVDVFYRDEIISEISNNDLIVDNSGLY